jgi:hypothetical protein
MLSPVEPIVRKDLISFSGSKRALLILHWTIVGLIDVVIEPGQCPMPASAYSIALLLLNDKFLRHSAIHGRVSEATVPSKAPSPSDA